MIRIPPLRHPRPDELRLHEQPTPIRWTPVVAATIYWVTVISLMAWHSAI